MVFSDGGRRDIRGISLRGGWWYVRRILYVGEVADVIRRPRRVRRP